MSAASIIYPDHLGACSCAQTVMHAALAQFLWCFTRMCKCHVSHAGLISCHLNPRHLYTSAAESRSCQQVCDKPFVSQAVRGLAIPIARIWMPCQKATGFAGFARRIVTGSWLERKLLTLQQVKQFLALQSLQDGDASWQTDKAVTMLRVHTEAGTWQTLLGGW